MEPADIFSSIVRRADRRRARHSRGPTGCDGRERLAPARSARTRMHTMRPCCWTRARSPHLGAAGLPHHEVLATPLACRGDARDVGAAPRAFHPPRAPPCARPVLADCSRYAETELYEHECYYMSKVVGTRCRL